MEGGKKGLEGQALADMERGDRGKNLQKVFQKGRERIEGKPRT